MWWPVCYYLCLVPVWKYLVDNLYIIQLPQTLESSEMGSHLVTLAAKPDLKVCFVLSQKCLFVILILVSGWQKQQLEHLFSNVTLISLHSIFYILLSDMIIFSVFKPWCCFLSFSVSSMPLNYDALCTISCHHICFLINSTVKKKRNWDMFIFYPALFSIDLCCHAKFLWFSIVLTPLMLRYSADKFTTY